MASKGETLEAAAKSKYGVGYGAVDSINAFIAGAKWQSERMYSEEEVYVLLLKHQSDYRSAVRNTSPLDWSFDIKDWFKQSRKILHDPRSTGHSGQ